MQSLKRQKRIEEKVFETIEEIADNLEIEPEVYPEVYLCDRKLYFEDLWLHESKRENFEDLKNLRGSWYNDLPPIIFIGKEHPADITEESAHFLHFNKSKIRYSKRNTQDKFSLNILTELVAYFCSKLVYPSRKNHYKSEPDLFFITPHNREKFLKELAKLNGKQGNYIAEEFYLYQQARGLAERMYFSFLEGNYTIKEFRELFHSDFKKENPTQKILELKLRFWKPENFKELIKDITQTNKDSNPKP